MKILHVESLLLNSTPQMSDCIKVVCRFRPFAEYEKGTECSLNSIDESRIEIISGGFRKKFDFDRVFDMKTN